MYNNLDSQVIIQGNQVELDEIINIIDNYKYIYEGTVAYDSVNQNLICYYQTKEGFKLESFKKVLSSSLPPYMIPDFFIQMEDLPKSSNGKIDKTQLPTLNLDDDENNQSIFPVTKQEYYKLSGSQRRLWILSKLKGGQIAYNMPFTFSLKGNINIKNLEKAIETLIERHESLRTIFIEIAGEPYQKILSVSELSNVFSYIDFSNDALNKQEINDILEKEVQIVFDLSSGPLIKFKLIQLTADEYILFFCLHHIISDGWSMNVITKDLMHIYYAYINNETNPLVPLDIQYKDYAEWNNQQDANNQLKHQLDYWKKQFEGEIPVFDFPTDKARPKVKSFLGNQLSFEIDTHLTNSIKTLCQEEDITLFMALLAFIKTLLYRYTNINDIIVGVPVAGREDLGLENQVGLYVNTLALRTKFDKNILFKDLLAIEKKVTLGAYDNQTLGFDKLLDELNISRDLSRSPLFDIMVVLQNNETIGSNLTENKNLQISPYKLNQVVSKFDVTFNFIEIDDILKCTIEYNSDIFDKERFEIFIEHFLKTIKELVRNPLAKIDEFDIVTENERSRLIQSFNKTDKEYSQDKTVIQLFEERVKTDPYNNALIYNNKTISYQELNASSNCIANFIRELNLKEDEFVAIYLDKKPYMIESLIGILKAGSPYVPIDIRWPQKRIYGILKDLKIKLIITDLINYTSLSEIIWSVSEIEHLLCIDVNEQKMPPEELNEDSVAGLWDHVSEKADDFISAGGFYSSYTGEKFSREEIFEYRDRVLNIAKEKIHPKSKVLEIGCGSGLIMFAIAPLVKSYTGIDPSKTTQNKNLKYIEENILLNIDLKTCFAHDIDLDNSLKYDLIILSSTIQFFPGVTYLINVLEILLEHLEVNGEIVIADIPDLNSKDEFIETLIQYQGEFDSISDKNDLLYLDENFFKRTSVLEDCNTEVKYRKKGFDNELKYRFDVVIRKKTTNTDELNSILKLYTRSDVKQNVNFKSVCNPKKLAYVIFTSGSTGKPNGVKVYHNSIVNLVEWVNTTFNINQKDRLLFVTSICFDLSVYDVFGILSSGGSIYIPTNEDLNNHDRIIDILNQQKITFWDSAPAYLEQLMPIIEKRTDSYLSKLRLVFLSGDWISIKLTKAIKEKYKGLTFVSLGGATEATVWSNYYIVDHVRNDWQSIPYGKPIQNSKYYILNPKLRLCPVGITGDLYISGICLSGGYINNQTLTRERFLTNPYSSADNSNTIYKTGDLARYFTDGNIEFLGRKDEQIKIRGYRIELGEIKSTILEYKEIKDCLVVKTGKDDDAQIVAYYVTREKINQKELKRFLSLQLPNYMVPSHLIYLDKFPVSQNGKIDRKLLPSPTIDHNREYKPPTNEMEIKIQSIWNEVLKVKGNKISIDDNFFDIGGNSLKAVKLVHLIEKKMLRKFSIQMIFDNPTIESQSLIIHNQNKKENYNILKVPKSEYYETSNEQKRMFYMQQLSSNSIYYNTPYILKIEGQIELRKLEYAFKEIIERHENFRSSFHIIDYDIVQKISQYTDFKIRIFNSYSRSQTNKIIKEFIQPFNLDKSPILRVGLIKEQYIQVLVIDTHHILIDAHSFSIIVNDLLGFYYNKELPKLEFQYKDYVNWQNKSDIWKEAILNQEKFWLNEFQNGVPRLNLPLDYDRPNDHFIKGDKKVLRLLESETSEIRALAKNNSTTTFIILFSIYKVFLHKLCNQQEIIAGYPVECRRFIQDHPIVGMFTNTLCLLNNINPSDNYKSYLGKFTEKIVNTYNNREYPFDSLVNKLGLTKEINRNPIFDTVFWAIESVNKDFRVQSDIKISAYEFNLNISQFELGVAMREVGQSIELTMHYKNQIFNTETISKFIFYYKEIINCICRNQNILINDLPSFRN